EAEALAHWIDEVGKLKRFLEEQLETTIEDDALREAIKKGNRERIAR
ncbi:MAG: 2-hydroxyacyl-CoA dehydratase, partial [Hyphomicrobiaceae bacterium]